MYDNLIYETFLFFPSYYNYKEIYLNKF